MVLEIRSAAEALGRRLHPDSSAELRAITRIMNAYYSNLIEGHNTRLHDIEAALAGQLEAVEDRPLAQEAAAHVRAQEWINESHVRGEPPDLVSVNFIQDLHRRFHGATSEEFRFIEHDGVCKEIVLAAISASGACVHGLLRNALLRPHARRHGPDPLDSRRPSPAELYTSLP